MTTDYEAIVTRWFEEVWNQRRQRTIDEVMAPNCLTKVEGIDGRQDVAQALGKIPGSVLNRHGDDLKGNA